MPVAVGGAAASAGLPAMRKSKTSIVLNLLICPLVPVTPQLIQAGSVLRRFIIVQH